jgi:archaeosine-15-forming tRNA-guanine transglycosylase
MKLFFIPLTAILLSSCSSSSNLITTTKAARVVHQASDETVGRVSIGDLNSSFLESGSESNYNHSVIEIAGNIIAYGLTEEGVYTVTLRENDHEALCTFEESISKQLGGGRTISSGASVTVRGQCQSTGFFASHPFTLHGCKIVAK